MLRRYSVSVAGESRAVEIEYLAGNAVRAVVDGREHLLDLRILGSGAPSVVFSWLEGNAGVCALVDGAGPRLTVGLRGWSGPVEIVDARPAALAASLVRPPVAGPLTVRAPMPGRLAKILVRVGEAVAANGALVVVEAMKMENEIRSTRAGTVRDIRCTEGASIEAGQELVILE